MKVRIERPYPQVTVYVRPWCGSVMRVKRWLDQRQIPYTEIDISKDRMWDEATYQAAMTPVSLFQDVYENRPDQREALAELYGENVVERAMNVG